VWRKSRFLKHSIGGWQHAGAWALERRYSSPSTSPSRRRDNMDRAGQVLAQGVPPGGATVVLRLHWQPQHSASVPNKKSRKWRHRLFSTTAILVTSILPPSVSEAMSTRDSKTQLKKRLRDFFGGRSAASPALSRTQSTGMLQSDARTRAYS